MCECSAGNRRRISLSAWYSRSRRVVISCENSERRPVPRGRGPWAAVDTTPPDPTPRKGTDGGGRGAAIVIVAGVVDIEPAAEVTEGSEEGVVAGRATDPSDGEGDGDGSGDAAGIAV